MKSKKNYSFLSEEIGKIINKNKDILWIIDPIDGTTNFLHGIPHFAISIALQVEGEISIGLIFDPIKNESLFATNNDGISSIHPKLNLRNTGCAALDLAYVGCGRFDGYFHNKINIWDIAAGKIIIEEAGGRVNDLTKFEINKINIRAGNPNIYVKMLKKLDKF